MKVTFKRGTARFKLVKCSGMLQDFQQSVIVPFIPAKPRGIAIPGDLETEVQSLVQRSKLILKSSKHWLNHRQNKKDTVLLMSTVSKDYRNIIEGLQVSCRLCILKSRRNMCMLL